MRGRVPILSNALDQLQVYKGNLNMSKKIILITDEPQSEAIKNAVKMLATTGDYKVEIETPETANMLHIALGLLSPTRCGFIDHQENDSEKDDADEQEDVEIATVEVIPDEEVEVDVDVEDPTDFTFESAGFVSIDGEMVEAFLAPDAETTVLEAANIKANNKRVDYTLNESKFACYRQVEASAEQSVTAEHRVAVNNEWTLVTVELKESEANAKPRLIVGADYKRLFA